MLPPLTFVKKGLPGTIWYHMRWTYQGSGVPAGNKVETTSIGKSTIGTVQDSDPEYIFLK
jgi:hypothetical protein